ncbi:F-box protein At4g27050-like [Salvia miltiorrhiza]|uniref:F-box protein At4g27050-like n=1 Tax=Salvia miltiorrhiza TaxID=226208 RepID=UPI0025AD4604|nr:F-box protein At4g27050-like [Salvia miltiorrhiza]
MGNSIDSLPDDLLISIVSFLPVKEAATTCTVAKRWQNLWMFSRVLEFDGSKMAPKFENGNRISVEREKEIFVNCVNRVLDLHLSETIDEFNLALQLYSPNLNHNHYRSVIDRWILFALRKKVRKLKLDFNPNLNYLFRLGLDAYAFPNIAHDFSSALLDQSALVSLVSLSLTRVSTSGEIVGFFISNCPFLQVLHLKHVCGLGSLSPRSPAIRLRSLVIFDCKDIASIEICSPSLVSFEFTILNSSTYATLVLNGVSSLIHLNLRANDPGIISRWLMDISGCLSRLETLILVTFMPQHVEVPLLFPDLPRLQKLHLHVETLDTQSLLCFVRLINSAPLLHSFKLVLDHGTQRRQARRLHNQEKLQCLKVFAVEGFSSTAVAMEMLLYVLENAASLEKMIIDGKVIVGEEVELLKAQLADSPSCAQDIINSLMMLLLRKRKRRKSSLLKLL